VSPAGADQAHRQRANAACISANDGIALAAPAASAAPADGVWHSVADTACATAAAATAAAEAAAGSGGIGREACAGCAP
jgi:hypothetical protein